MLAALAAVGQSVERDDGHRSWGLPTPDTVGECSDAYSGNSAHGPGFWTRIGWGLSGLGLEGPPDTPEAPLSHPSATRRGCRGRGSRPGPQDRKSSATGCRYRPARRVVPRRPARWRSPSPCLLLG